MERQKEKPRRALWRSDNSTLAGRSNTTRADPKRTRGVWQRVPATGSSSFGVRGGGLYTAQAELFAEVGIWRSYRNKDDPLF